MGDNNQNRKREREYDSPEKLPFQRSRLIKRSPTKTTNERGTKIDTNLDKEMEQVLIEMRKMTNGIREEIKIGNENMLETWKKQFTSQIMEIKEDINQIKEQVREQLVAYQNEKSEWQEEKKKLEDRLSKMEQKMEVGERKIRMNNLVIVGVEEVLAGKEDVKTEVLSFFKEKLEVEPKIAKAYKIGQNRCVVEMEQNESKAEVMKNKKKLKGSRVFINDDLTIQERKIQTQLRNKAKEEREKGRQTTVGYKKLWIDGKKFVWNEITNELQQKASEPLTTKN